MTITPIAFENWPEGTKRAWHAGIARETWSRAFGLSVRRAYCRLLGFAASRSPDDTEEQLFKAYGEWLLEHYSRATAVPYLELCLYAVQVVDPATDHASLVRFCRDFRHRHLSWTPRQSRKCARPFTVGLPLREWPEPLRSQWDRKVARTERRRYRDRRCEDGGRSHRWSDAYKERVARGYGMYLRMAASEGFGWEPTADAIDRFCELRHERVSSVSLASYVWEIYEASAILFPEKDWQWLREDAQFLKGKAKPSRKKETRIAHASDLRKLGHNLLKTVLMLPIRVSTALDFRDALLVLFLSYKPARLRNVGEMRFGHELRLGEGGGSFFVKKTKNGRPDGHPLSQELAAYFQKFRDLYWPLLPDADKTDYVWLSKLGGPLCLGAISAIVGDLTEKHLGKRISPHFFRDAIATSIAEYGPEVSGATQILLGQRDQRSSEPYEQHARSIEAARKLETITDRFLVLPPAKTRMASRKSERTE